MRLPVFFLLTVFILQACGGSGGGPTVAPAGPVNMDDFARYIVTAESDKAIVASNASSPFGNQAIKRTIISSVDEVQQYGNIRVGKPTIFRFSSKATPAQIRQFAQYGKTALSNPKNAAVLTALLATGVVVGYELLETEDDAEPVPITPQPGTGVAYADISQLASKEDLLKGLKSYKIPKKMLKAVSEELSLPSQGAVHESLKIPSNKTTLGTKPLLLPASSEDAKIEGVSFSYSFGRDGKFYRKITITGQITNQTRTIVKARFYDQAGLPLRSADSKYSSDSGQLEITQVLLGVISGSRFHQYTSTRPLKLYLPDSAFPKSINSETVKCRVEVLHKNSGKLLAATLPISIPK